MKKTDKHNINITFNINIFSKNKVSTDGKIFTIIVATVAAVVTALVVLQFCPENASDIIISLIGSYLG